MAKKIKFKQILIIYLIMFAFLIFNAFFGKVLAVKPGQMILIPSDLPQYSAQYEEEDINWNEDSKQYKVNQTWKEQGKPVEQSEAPLNCAYLTLAGEKRYFVALTPTFGEAGDYIDVYIQDGNEEKVFKCVMGDAKGRKDDNGNDVGYDYNGIFTGHKYQEDGVDKCDILEFILKDYNDRPSGEFLGKFTQITKIYNGGSYFDHPNGPEPWTENVVLGGGTSSSSSSTSGGTSATQSEESFQSVMLSWYRSMWSFLSTGIDNIFSGRQDSNNFYFTQIVEASEVTGGQSGINPNAALVGDANICKTCQQLTTYLMSKNAHYNADHPKAGDINYNYNNPDYNICCATYVAIALWKSGKLTEDFINRYNYNWTGNRGIPTMLKDAGWVSIPPKQATPGDVIVNYEIHAAICAGNAEVSTNGTVSCKIWDEASATIGTHGEMPFGTTYSYNITNCQVWRESAH